MLSVTLNSSSDYEEKYCQFKLKETLIQCRVYTVEIIFNYRSLRGQSLTTEIVIPPAKVLNLKTIFVQTMLKFPSFNRKLVQRMASQL